MEIRIWNWCKQAVLVTTEKWIKLNYFFVPFRTFMSVDISITFFLRKPIQIAYKLKCSKTQQVWLSFIFNNELKYFCRHFFILSCTSVFTRHFWITYNKIVMRRLHLNLKKNFEKLRMLIFLIYLLIGTCVSIRISTWQRHYWHINFILS